MNRTATAVINTQALRHNLMQVKKYAPQSRVMSVIKANAYGHGLIEVAEALVESDGFAVASIHEGLALRDIASLSNKPIMIFQGFHDRASLIQCVQFNLQPVIHQAWQVDMLSEEPLQKPIDVWLKINTGMNRLGVDSNEAQILWQRLNDSSSVATSNVMTHMACADGGINNDQANTSVLNQFACFKNATKGITADQSLANSASLIDWPELQADWVRPGIMLYGVSPFSTFAKKHNLDLKPVMTLKTRLISINQLSAGDAVGYGETWIAPKPMKIGVVAIGYGDGYPRHIKDGTPILINGQQACIVGRVSMDMLTVDLSTVENPVVGDEVILWGEGLPVEDIAEAADTIGYELLCGIHGRVQAVYQ